MPTNTMEALLVRRFVSATGLQGRALLRTRTPKVIRQPKPLRATNTGRSVVRTPCTVQRNYIRKERQMMCEQIRTYSDRLECLHNRLEILKREKAKYIEQIKQLQLTLGKQKEVSTTNDSEDPTRSEQSCGHSWTWNYTKCQRDKVLAATERLKEKKLLADQQRVRLNALIVLYGNHLKDVKTDHMKTEELTNDYIVKGRCHQAAEHRAYFLDKIHTVEMEMAEIDQTCPHCNSQSGDLDCIHEAGPVNDLQMYKTRLASFAECAE